MRTEDDIRQALDLESDHAAVARLTGFADEIGAHDLPDRAAVAVHRPRRRAMPLLAAAAVVVVVAGGAVAVAQLQHHSSNATAGTGTPTLSAAHRRPVWNLRIAPVKGYTVTRISASSIRLANGSLFLVRSTDSSRPDKGVITTCPGYSLMECTRGISHAKHITIDGRPGLFHPVGDGNPQPGIAWFAGHHTVVDIGGRFGYDPSSGTYDNAAAERTLLRIAAATSAGHRDAAQLPFALAGLPGRVAPESVVIGLGACSDYGTGPVTRNDALGTVFTACRELTGSSRAATIRAADHVSNNEIGQITGLDPDAIIVHNFADGTSIVISIVHGGSRTVTQAQAERIAADADVSPDLHDQSTWLTVR